MRVLCSAASASLSPARPLLRSRSPCHARHVRRVFRSVGLAHLTDGHSYGCLCVHNNNHNPSWRARSPWVRLPSYELRPGASPPLVQWATHISEYRTDIFAAIHKSTHPLRYSIDCRHNHAAVLIHQTSFCCENHDLCRICSAQLSLYSSQVDNAGAAELAKALAANSTLTTVCCAPATTKHLEHGGCRSCVIERATGKRSSEGLPSPAPPLGAVRSRLQPNRRCGHRGTREGTCYQPYADLSLLAFATMCVLPDPCRPTSPCPIPACLASCRWAMLPSARWLLWPSSTKCLACAVLQEDRLGNVLRGAGEGSFPIPGEEARFPSAGWMKC